MPKKTSQPLVLRALVRELIGITDTMRSHLRLREAMRETAPGAKVWWETLEMCRTREALIIEELRRVVK